MLCISYTTESIAKGDHTDPGNRKQSAKRPNTQRNAMTAQHPAPQKTESLSNSSVEETPGKQPSNASQNETSSGSSSSSCTSSRSSSCSSVRPVAMPTLEVVKKQGSAAPPNDQHSHSLSSYIKRSLSGLFSDIAGVQEQHQQEQQSSDEDHLRMPSTISQETLYTSSQQQQQQQQQPTPSAHKAFRRRSFSYQCLTKLFHVDDDCNNINSQHHDEGRQSSSPRTVAARPDTPDSRHKAVVEAESPFQLPQPPLEESESMHSFMDVLGAAAVDDLEHDTIDDPMDCHPVGQVDDGIMMMDTTASTTAADDDTFGWYISEEGAKGVLSTLLTPPPSLYGSSSSEAHTLPLPPQKPDELEEYSRAADTIDNVLGDFFA